MWAKRGRINETLSDSHEVTHMVYLVISPSLLLSSLIQFYFPTGHLSFTLSSFASALMPTPPHQRCCDSDSRQMFDATFAKSKQGEGVGGGGRDRKCTHANECTRCHMHCTVTAAPRWVWVSLCYMQSTSSKFFCTQTRTYTHTDTSPVPTSEERGCVVVAGVTGSPSPQLTNRYNQLSWDTSCCCHSHYSWTNTYIKQSGGHWPLHYIDTHTRIHAHSCYIFNTHMHARTVIYT